MSDKIKFVQVSNVAVVRPDCVIAVYKTSHDLSSILQMSYGEYVSTDYSFDDTIALLGLDITAHNVQKSSKKGAEK